MAGRRASAQPYAAGPGDVRPPRVRHEDNLEVADRGKKFQGESVTRQAHNYQHGFQTPPAKVFIDMLINLRAFHII